MTQKPEKQNINWGELIRTNWQIIMIFVSIGMTVISMFYRLPQAEAQIRENKEDIKALNTRVNTVEGDIKSILTGIEFIKAELK